MTTVSAFAPGRVNLMGDHTDHTGGLCLPMALSMGVTVTGERGGQRILITSENERRPARLPLEVDDPSSVEPAWARYVAGVAAQLRPSHGFVGAVTSDLPAGAGLSSSAALEVAVAMALTDREPGLELARACQRAEQAATGVPCGILDQLTSVGGVAGHALVMDCHRLTLEPVPVPADMEVVVVHSGQERDLASSPYAARRRECDEAQARIGPLRSATLDDARGLGDEALRRRARHVVSENQRVREAADALRNDDRAALGELFVASHRSLREDFECTTPVVDALVDRLCATPGVHGARMTGGGWGGCVVAVCEPGALREGWVVRPGAGARRLSRRAGAPSGRRTRPR